MYYTLREISSTIYQALRIIPIRQRYMFTLAVLLMAITGALTAVPAIVVGHLVDSMLNKQFSSFTDAIPYLLCIIAAVTMKELLTICRKWIVENNCTRLQKQQSVDLVFHLLRLDLSSSLLDIGGKTRIGRAAYEYAMRVWGNLWHRRQPLIDIHGLSFTSALRYPSSTQDGRFHRISEGQAIDRQNIHGAQRTYGLFAPHRDTTNKFVD